MVEMRTAGHDIRPFRDEDGAGVCELLDEALVVGPTGGPPSRLFRWKHLDNPFGRSFMLVAEAEGRIVGFRAFMRWRFRAGDRIVEAVRAVDTATDPRFQGQGIFSSLTRAALQAVEGSVDLVFNTPNQKSGPGYLKMGWRSVGRIPVDVRLRRPLRAAGAVLRTGREVAPRPEVRADKAAEAIESISGLDELLAEGVQDPRLATDRDVRYLRWRYGSPPDLDYHIVRRPGRGPVGGVAVFRVRRRGRLWETSVADLLVRPGDIRTARALLRDAARAAATDHVACLFPRGSTPERAARRAAFLPWPGPRLMVNPLRLDAGPGPEDLRGWALTLGDVEVF